MLLVIICDDSNGLYALCLMKTRPSQFVFSCEQTSTGCLISTLSVTVRTFICDKLQRVLCGKFLKDGSLWAANAACVGNPDRGSLVGPFVVLAFVQELRLDLTIISDILHLHSSAPVRILYEDWPFSADVLSRLHAI